MPSEEAKKIFQFEAAEILRELIAAAQNLRVNELDKIKLISQKAHTLKGSAEQFEFPNISNKAGEVEKLLKEQLNPGVLRRLKKIIKYIDRECQKLKSY